jgi:hypothetical protein
MTFQVEAAVGQGAVPDILPVFRRRNAGMGMAATGAPGGSGFL